jgi:hypothetical protein
MIDVLREYYRCSEQFLRFAPKGPLSGISGYFQLGDEVMCFGKYHGRKPTQFPGGTCPDSKRDIDITDEMVYLPFDPSQVVQNLRCETYVSYWQNETSAPTLADLYYFIRPILPVRIRKHLQKMYLHGWERISFPRWPVDRSVDKLLEALLLFSVRSSHVQQIPFIWFWPEGAPSCAIMTHDVETVAGRDSCAFLMDIDDSFDVKASFQIVPEERYLVEREFLSSIRDRGFELGVHDLNHDGHLYRTRQRFLERAAKINAYGKEFGADGFRAGILYRRQLWYDVLDFAYDMSVPNVAHLDPQRGGCCTVMPYFIGNILELPVTTTQDYTLFNILNKYSIALWKRQMELIMENHGLMSFLIHPDYIMAPGQRAVYEELLSHITRLREENNVWVTTPGEVNRWWRQRANMQLVETGEGWQIEGDGAERARIAFASEKDGALLLSMQAPVVLEDMPVKSPR